MGKHDILLYIWLVTAFATGITFGMIIGSSL
jgi:hypothetical protein